MGETQSPLRLLSLDGGGIRGYSTLLLLKAIFEQIEEIQGKPSLPCEIFDLIAGTSTGGIIAVMLGPLRMNVKECIDAYLDMAPEVFPEESRIKRTKCAVFCGLVRGKERFDATPLENFLQKTIQKKVEGRSDKGKETFLRFEAVNGGPRCKIFLCSKSKMLNQLFRFRNYHFPGDTIPDCPLWQACRATSAATTIFPPMEIGRTHTRYADGGMGANNPIEELMEEARILWKNKRDIGCVVSLGTGVPALVNIQEKLKGLVKVLVSMATDTQKIHEKFLNKMVSAYGLHQEFYFRFNVEHGLENISLEEWKQLESVDVATGSYISQNHEAIKKCAETLLRPIAPRPFPEGLHRWPRYMVFEDHQSENYVERQLYSDQIDTCFKQAGSTLRRVAIYGLPGMGKSQLVYDYVKRHHTKYLAVFAANARTLQNVEASFNLFFEELCLPKVYEDDQGRRVRAVLQWLRTNSSWLLIFDNVQEKDYNRLKHYMPQSDYGHVMITTRSEWVGRTFGSAQDNLALHIEEMLHNTAIELLLRSSQLRARENEALMRDLASDVVNELWHVPLTIEFVGKGHRSEEALRKILSVLRDISARENFVDVYKQDDEPLGYDQKSADGTTTFVTLYMVGSVSPEAKQLWDVMAFLSPSWYAESLFNQIKVPSQIPLGHIACNQDTLKRYFGELYDLGFISSTHDKYGYWTHDQIQLVARVSLRKEPGKQGEFASTAASWISRAFPDYNTYQKKWIHNLEYLTHARNCIGYCEQLHVETADLQRLYYTSSNYARFIGDYTTAKYLAQKATKILDPSMSNRHDYFKAHESYALALRRESDFESAKTILRAMLIEQERELGADDPGTITTLNELGWTIYLQGSVAVSGEAEPLLQEAERFLRDAMKRREERLTPRAGATQHTYQNLATCLAKQNKFEEAEKLYSLAFDGHKKLFGTENHHWVQHIKGNIAKMNEMQGKLGDAMSGFRGVMEWREKDINFGSKHPDTLRVASSLARVYQKLGRHEEAMELGRKTRKLYAEVFGEDHQETADLDDWINRNLSGNEKEEYVSPSTEP